MTNVSLAINLTQEAGQRYTPDDQCVLMLGSTSFYCGVNSFIYHGIIYGTVLFASAPIYLVNVKVSIDTGVDLSKILKEQTQIWGDKK